MQAPNPFLGNLLLLLGGLGLTAGVACLAFPRGVRAGLLAFPRSKWPGWILTAVCVFWITWVIRHAALGRFEVVKPVIPVLGFLTFGAVVWLLDELLAPRALGGLLMLVANPMLMGVRWADSAWRFVIVAIAYAWVIAGCALMLHPWLFRKLAAPFTDNPGRLRLVAAGKLLGGGILLAAGFWLR